MRFSPKFITRSSGPLLQERQGFHASYQRGVARRGPHRRRAARGDRRLLHLRGRGRQAPLYPAAQGRLLPRRGRGRRRGSHPDQGPGRCGAGDLRAAGPDPGRRGGGDDLPPRGLQRRCERQGEARHHRHHIGRGQDVEGRVRRVLPGRQGGSDPPGQRRGGSRLCPEGGPGSPRGCRDSQNRGSPGVIREGRRQRLVGCWAHRRGILRGGGGIAGDGRRLRLARETSPLEIRLPAVEEFDEELLPEPLRAWVLDVAKRMDNAAPDFVAAAVVVQAGALIGRKVGIYPKRHDDWMVIPNLWGGLVGPPASMKTPALEQAIKPIKRLAALAREAYEEALKQHDLDKMVAAAEKYVLKKQLEDKAKKVAAGGVPRKELDTIREKIQDLEEPEVPTQRRYVTNDSTIEKLAEILAVNPDGILYYSDELMRFLKGLDRVGREADRAFYLEAWNGNGSFEVDRIGRGSLHVPALCISLLGGIQPGPLTKYVGDALAEAEKADGLLQRFQVLVYPDQKDY